MTALVSRTEFEELWGLVALGRQESFARADTLLQHHRDPLSVALVSGLAFLAEGKAGQAYAAFSQAAAANPDDARSYLGLAQSLLKLGHFEKAIAAGLQALRLDPGCWQSGLAIADALEASGRGAQAIAQYQRLLANGVASSVVHLGLGAALQKAGRLSEAKAQFHEAIRLAPDCAAGYCNLGNALTAMGAYREAGKAYRQALPLSRAARDILHANLAKVALVTGDFAGAEKESRRALALNPEFADAHGFLAEALARQGRPGEAVPHYRSHGTPEAAAKALECLYRLGDMAAFEAAQTALVQSQPDNLRLAALGALAAAQHGPRYASQFCADPMRYIAVRNVAPLLAPFDAFAGQLLDEARALESVWEPPDQTTKGGYQTRGNIFDLATPAVARLRQVLGECIADYFASHAGSADRYVTQAPKTLTLSGWVVRLRRQGRQDMHIHPDGWLSGVLYLKLPPRASSEGAIGFSLGAGAAVADVQHQPREGELVLFPSSLFHYTVPFAVDSERDSIAFDLLPQKRG